MVRRVRPKQYAVVPDKVWDGISDHAQSGLAVIIEDTTINAVVRQTQVPVALTRIEMPGCTLLPGLIDAHVHFCDWMRPAFLAAGVTTVRDVGNDLPWVLKQRRFAEKNPRLSPRLLCCGPLLDGPQAWWPIIGRAHADAAAIEASIAALAAQRVAGVKLYVNLTAGQMKAAVSAAHRHGLHVLAHLGRCTAAQAAAAGVDEIEHLTGCAPAWKQSSLTELDRLCVALREVVMCPTLVVWDRIGRVREPVFPQDRRLDWAHPEFVSAWQDYPGARTAAGRLKLQRSVVEMKRCVARMHQRGLTIIAGSDTPFSYLIPGFSLHDEVALMADAGLTPVEALRTATSAAARALRLDQVIGTVQAGRCADLLAVRGDPTDNLAALARVAHVIRNGVLLKRTALRRLARQLQARAADDPASRAILTHAKAERG